MTLGTGSPFFLAGVNFQRETCSAAFLSRSGSTDRTIFDCWTVPSVPMRMLRTTVPWNFFFVLAAVPPVGLWGAVLWSDLGADSFTFSGDAAIISSVQIGRAHV